MVPAIFGNFQAGSYVISGLLSEQDFVMVVKYPGGILFYLNGVLTISGLGVNILAKTPNISPPPKNWDPNLPLVFNRSREFSRSFFLPNNDEISFFLLLN